MIYDTLLPQNIRNGFEQKVPKKRFDLIKLTMYALVASCLLPYSIHEWQIVTITMHKQGVYWLWEFHSKPFSQMTPKELQEFQQSHQK